MKRRSLFIAYYDSIVGKIWQPHKTDITYEEIFVKHENSIEDRRAHKCVTKNQQRREFCVHCAMCG